LRLAQSVAADGQLPVRTSLADLDVVHPRDGRDPFIDDEDEFALHQVEFGYPPEVITTAESAVRDLLTAVTARRPPFDGSAEPWLNLLNQEPMGEVI
jgi:protein associated with RNAse G/E